jgi:hypothetical protein
MIQVGSSLVRVTISALLLVVVNVVNYGGKDRDVTR